MHADDDAALPIGEHIDAYEIVDRLGRGGFGITYKVFDQGLNSHFALKEFFPADLVSRDGSALKLLAKNRADADYQWARRKFLDEARLLAQLSHPNIVNVCRVLEANNTVYMLLDFIPGSTLESWLKRIGGPPTQEELDLIAGPLLSALELVHDNGMCHLDVAPDNVLIRSSDGAPILLDFGAARLEIKQRSQLVSAMLFKSGYSAPEQYTSSANRYGPWTDIYAAGATLYRAIAGDRPIESTERSLKDQLQPATAIGNRPLQGRIPASDRCGSSTAAGGAASDGGCMARTASGRRIECDGRFLRIRPCYSAGCDTCAFNRPRQRRCGLGRSLLYPPGRECAARLAQPFEAATQVRIGGRRGARAPGSRCQHRGFLPAPRGCTANGGSRH
jgi:serine/threonine protein kinase